MGSGPRCATDWLGQAFLLDVFPALKYSGFAGKLSFLTFSLEFIKNSESFLQILSHF